MRKSPAPLIVAVSAALLFGLAGVASRTCTTQRASAELSIGPAGAQAASAGLVRRAVSMQP